MTAVVQGNLSEQAYNTRLRQGLFSLTVALIAAVLMVRFGLPTYARLLLFVPFFGAAFGGLQGIFRTCSFAASAGQRVTEHGHEPVCNAHDRKDLRRMGRKVLLLSVGFAVAATGASMLIPSV